MNRAARVLAILLLSLLIAVGFCIRGAAAQSNTASVNQRNDSPGAARWPWQGVSEVVSIVAAGLSLYFFVGNVKLTRKIADRTVTVTAQQFLLEINKQYLSDPALFAIYDDWPGRDKLFLEDPNFVNRLKAMGYLKLNVFEIVFAALSPGSDEYDAWVAYFDDSLNRCSVLRDELANQPKIYGRKLLAAFRRWQNTGSANITPSETSTPRQVPLPFTTAAIGLLVSLFFHNSVGGVTATLIGFATGALIVFLTGRVPSHE
jgi:hypothetical protein